MTQTTVKNSDYYSYITHRSILLLISGYSALGIWTLKHIKESQTNLEYARSTKSSFLVYYRKTEMYVIEC